ncbi:hypothetical protein [Capsulimonas corticalis]|uniref:hypothetical protein n=1 Tax=Capsulimonas corticalis TaxID=2219043 RepID=UPI000F6510EE|nr:hypothetical protein [Capsulimonas corticalis]
MTDLRQRPRSFLQEAIIASEVTAYQIRKDNVRHPLVSVDLRKNNHEGAEAMESRLGKDKIESAPTVPPIRETGSYPSPLPESLWNIDPRILKYLFP